jgi:hypothetical protein
VLTSNLARMVKLSFFLVFEHSNRQ